MKKRRNKPVLPRLSVMAMSSKEAIRFVAAVEKAAALSLDLLHLVPRLKEAVEKLEARTRRRRPGPGQSQEGQPS